MTLRRVFAGIASISLIATGVSQAAFAAPAIDGTNDGDPLATTAENSTVQPQSSDSVDQQIEDAQSSTPADKLPEQTTAPQSSQSGATPSPSEAPKQRSVQKLAGGISPMAIAQPCPVGVYYTLDRTNDRKLNIGAISYTEPPAVAWIQNSYTPVNPSPIQLAADNQNGAHYINALGAAQDGSFWFVDQRGNPGNSVDVYHFTPDDNGPGTLTKVRSLMSLNTNSANSLVGGGVDPTTGEYYFGYFKAEGGPGQVTLHLFRVSETDASRSGKVARIQFPVQSDFDRSATNGDLVFDSVGNMYAVTSDGSNMVRVDVPKALYAELPGLATGNGPLITIADSIQRTVQSGAVNGVALTDNGHAITEAGFNQDMRDVQTFNLVPGSSTTIGGTIGSLVDLASCGNTPPLIPSPSMDTVKSADPAAGGAVQAGKKITYKVRTTNTGNTVLNPVNITDDLSGVLSYATLSGTPSAQKYASDNTPVNPTGAPTLVGTTLSWNGALDPGEYVVLTYSVIVNQGVEGQVLKNRVNSSGTPPSGPPITPPERSTQHPVPGFKLTKTAAPVSQTEVTPGQEITYTVTGTNTGATVLNPVNITDNLAQVLNNATLVGSPTATIGGIIAANPTLTGTNLAWTGSLQVGQSVVITYKVKVNNGAEGKLLKNHVEGQATPPGLPPITPPPVETEHPVPAPGFTLNKTADPVSGTKVYPGQEITYTVTGANTGTTVLNPVNITDDLAQVLNNAVLVGSPTATIGGVPATNPTLTGTNLAWTGSLQVGQSVVITYKVKVNDNAKGVVLKNHAVGQATPPGMPPITPPPVETEHPVPTPGFTLSKISDPASGTKVNPGQTITYTVTGSNTGETILNPVDITDDLSAVLDKAAFNNDAVAKIDGAPVGAVVRNGNVLSWTGSLAPGKSVVITYSVKVNDDATGKVLNNVAQGKATPPGPPGIPPIAPPPVRTEHPVPAPGFGLTKSANPISGTEVSPGQVITYTVTGSNTGETVLDPVVITDDLSAVVDKAVFANDAVAKIDGNVVGTVVRTGNVLSWTGSLAAGKSVVITYSATVSAVAVGKVLNNHAEGSAQPPSGDPEDPVPPITPPPVETEHPVPAPGFTLNKTADPVSGTKVNPGQVITYTVTGSNTGETVLDPVVITDDLSDVLDKATYNSDAVATINGQSAGAVTLNGNELSWTGTLAAGKSVVITYSVKVNNDAAGKLLKNHVEGKATPPGPPGTPPIAPPPVETEHPVPAPGFALNKTADPVSGTKVNPGQVITYTVTGSNTGETILNPVTITDDLSAVVDKAVFANDAVAKIDGNVVGTVVRKGNILSWTGSLAAGKSVVITYSATVSAVAVGKVLNNHAEGSAQPPSEDPENPVPPITPPPVETEHPVPTPGFELTKSADPDSGTEVEPGQTITYTVTGSNTGETVLDPVVITDDLAKVLNNAEFNNDAVATIDGAPVGAVVRNANVLSWTGALAAGKNVVITYSVTTNEGATGIVLNNVAEGSATPPGQPPISPPPVETEHPVPGVPGFVIAKSADPVSGTRVLPGGTITYTVTAQNTGDLLLDPASLHDDLSGVLAHATYNGDVVATSGNVTVNGNDLDWTGTLAKGQKVTITYSVKVKDDARGVVINNVVTGEATPQVPVDPTDPEGPTTPGEPIVPDEQRTQHPVPAPDFALTKTADPASGTPVAPGQTIKYTVKGANTGDTVLDPATITDDLSGVLASDKATYNGDAMATLGTVAVNGSTLNWNGVLKPGDTVEITYSVTVASDASGVMLNNKVTGSATPPGQPPVIPPPVGTEHPVPGFTFSKSASPASGTVVLPGEEITYTLTGTNTGATVLDPVVLTDDLAGVLNNAELVEDSPAATINGTDVEGPDVSGTTLTWTGKLEAGESVVVTYTVKVNSEARGVVLKNKAQGSATPPGLPPITPPPGETEHPVPAPGFTLLKSSDPESGSAVLPGQTIKYTITGENTGDTALDPATITDDLSGVFGDGKATYNNDVASTFGTVAITGNTLNWNGVLQPGDKVSITYSVTVDQDAAGAVLKNKVTGSATPPGQPPITPPPVETEHPVPGFEIAKTADPASGTTVEAGSKIVYTVTGTNTGATVLNPVEIHDDLAAVLNNAVYNGDATADKEGGVTLNGTELSWTGVLQPGETVTITYSVTVNADAAKGVVIKNVVKGEGTPPGTPPITPPPVETEHPVVKPGFEIEKTANPSSGTMVDPGGLIKYTVTGTNTGDTVLDPATISDDLSNVLNNADYNSDAVADKGTVQIVGNDLSWTGSLAPGEVVTITYSVTVKSSVKAALIHNIVTGTATPRIPEDPERPEGPTRPGEPINPPPVETEHPVVVPGFTIEKSAEPDSGTAVEPGDKVSYTVIATNTGNTVLDPATVVDDMSDVLDNATYNDDLQADRAGQLGLDGTEISWVGTLEPGESVKLTYSVTVKSDASAVLLHNVVTGEATPLVPKDPTDPKSPSTPGEPITPPPVETKHPVVKPGFETTKVANPESGTSVEPGAVVKYTVTGTNTGDTVLDPAQISDNLSDVLTYAEYDGNVIADRGDVSITGNTLTWDGKLNPGEKVTITYSVTIKSDPSVYGKQINNRVTATATPLIPEDPTDPKSPSTPGEPIIPEPKETEHPILTPEWTLTKTVDPTSGTAVDPGSTLTYTITGTNTGETDLKDVTITDDLSKVLDKATYNDDAAALLDGDDRGESLTLEGNTLIWQGDLLVGETVVITFSVNVNAEAAGNVVENVVEGTAVPPGTTPPPLPPVSPPPPVKNPVNKPGFSVSKAAEPETGTAVDPGATITYTVTGTNTGETALDPVVITDDLAGVLDKATYNDDAVATIGEGAAGAVVVENGKLVWTGRLAVGESVTITYSVTVAGDAGGKVVHNVVTGSATPPGTPPIQTPPAETEHPVNLPAFEVAKSADPASGTAVDPGSVIKYTVTGTNTGQTALNPVVITDDLAKVLDKAAYNGDVSATSGTVVVEDGKLVWTGKLAVGEKVMITYSVTVAKDAGGKVVENVVSGKATPPGTPGTPPLTPPNQTTKHPVNKPGFTVEKSADPESGTKVKPGQTITYTVTGKNTGETILSPVVITDDMSEVLKYAKYNNDVVVKVNGASVGSAKVEGSTLSWSGVLKVGETVTITYSVTVNQDAVGKTLKNVVTGEATPPGGDKITPPPSSTEHPVIGGLPKTGAEHIAGFLGTASLLLVAGGLLLALRRRSERKRS